MRVQVKRQLGVRRARRAVRTLVVLASTLLNTAWAVLAAFCTMTRVLSRTKLGEMAMPVTVS